MKCAVRRITLAVVALFVLLTVIVVAWFSLKPTYLLHVKTKALPKNTVTVENIEQYKPLSGMAWGFSAPTARVENTTDCAGWQLGGQDSPFVYTVYYDSYNNAYKEAVSAKPDFAFPDLFSAKLEKLELAQASFYSRSAYHMESGGYDWSDGKVLPCAFSQNTLDALQDFLQSPTRAESSYQQGFFVTLPEGRAQLLGDNDDIFGWYLRLSFTDAPYCYNEQYLLCADTQKHFYILEKSNLPTKGRAAEVYVLPEALNAQFGEVFRTEPFGENPTTFFLPVGKARSDWA